MSILLPCSEPSCLVLHIPEVITETFIENIRKANIVYTTTFNKWYLTHLLNIDAHKIFPCKFNQIYLIKDNAGNTECNLCAVFANFAPGSAIYIWKDESGYTIYLGKFRFGPQLALNHVIKNILELKKPIVVHVVDASNTVGIDSKPPEHYVTPEFIISLLRRELSNKPNRVILGAPVLGFEKFLKEVAQALGVRLHVEGTRAKIFSHLRQDFCDTELRPGHVEVKDLDIVSYRLSENKVIYSPRCKFENSVYIKIGSLHKDENLEGMLTDRSNTLYFLPYEHNVSRSDLLALLDVLKPNKIFGVPEMKSHPMWKIPNYIQAGNCLQLDTKPNPSTRILSRDMLTSYKTNPAAVPKDLQSIFSHSPRMKLNSNATSKQEVESSADSSVNEASHNSSEKHASLGNNDSSVFEQDSKSQYIPKQLRSDSLEALKNKVSASDSESRVKRNQSSLDLSNNINIKNVDSKATEKLQQPVIGSSISSSFKNIDKQLPVNGEQNSCLKSSPRLIKNALCDKKVFFAIKKLNENQCEILNRVSSEGMKFVNKVSADEGKQGSSCDGVRISSVEKDKLSSNRDVDSDDVVSEKAKLRLKQIIHRSLRNQGSSKLPMSSDPLKWGAVLPNILRKSSVVGFRKSPNSQWPEANAVSSSGKEIKRDVRTDEEKSNEAKSTNQSKGQTLRNGIVIGNTINSESKSEASSKSAEPKKDPKEMKKLLTNGAPSHGVNYESSQSTHTQKMNGNVGNHARKDDGNKEKDGKIPEKKHNKELKNLVINGTANLCPVNYETDDSHPIKPTNEKTVSPPKEDNIVNGLTALERRRIKELNRLLISGTPNLCPINCESRKYFPSHKIFIGKLNKVKLKNNGSNVSSMLEKKHNKVSKNLLMNGTSTSPPVNKESDKISRADKLANKKVSYHDSEQNHTTASPKLLKDEHKFVKRKFEDVKDSSDSDSSVNHSKKLRENLSDSSSEKSAVEIQNGSSKPLMRELQNLAVMGTPKLCPVISDRSGKTKRIQNSSPGTKDVEPEQTVSVQTPEVCPPNKSENLKESISNEFKSVLARKTEEQFEMCINKVKRENSENSSKVKTPEKLSSEVSSKVKTEKLGSEVFSRIKTYKISGKELENLSIQGTSKLCSINNYSGIDNQLMSKLRCIKSRVGDSKKAVVIIKMRGGGSVSQAPSIPVTNSNMESKTPAAEKIPKKLSETNLSVKSVETVNDSASNSLTIDSESSDNNDSKKSSSSKKINRGLLSELKNLAIDGTPNLCPVNTSLFSSAFMKSIDILANRSSDNIQMNNSESSDDDKSKKLISSKKGHRQKGLLAELKNLAIDGTPNLCPVNTSSSQTIDFSQIFKKERLPANKDTSELKSKKSEKCVFNEVPSLNKKLDGELKKLIIDGTSNLCAVNCASSVMPENVSNTKRNSHDRRNSLEQGCEDRGEKLNMTATRLKSRENLENLSHNSPPEPKRLRSDVSSLDSSLTAKKENEAANRMEPNQLGHIKKEGLSHTNSEEKYMCDAKLNTLKQNGFNSKVSLSGSPAKEKKDPELYFWDDLTGIDVTELKSSKMTRVRKSSADQAKFFTPSIPSTTVYSAHIQNKTGLARHFLSNEIKEELINGMRINLSAKYNKPLNNEIKIEPTPNRSPRMLLKSSTKKDSPTNKISPSKTLLRPLGRKDPIIKEMKSLKVNLINDPRLLSLSVLKTADFKKPHQFPSVVNRKRRFLRPSGVRVQKAKRSTPFKTCKKLVNCLIENTDHDCNLDPSRRDFCNKANNSHPSKTPKSVKASPKRQKNERFGVKIPKNIQPKQCTVVIEDVEKKIHFCKTLGLQMNSLMPRKLDSRGLKISNLSFYKFPKRFKRMKRKTELY